MKRKIIPIFVFLFCISISFPQSYLYELPDLSKPKEKSGEKKFKQEQAQREQEQAARNIINSLPFKMDGNAHIFSYNDLKKLYDMKNYIPKLSAEEIYDHYDYLYKQYSDNKLLLEQKKEESKNTIIVIYGYVNQVRKSIFDEYIVELECHRDWAIMQFNVVFPKNISQAMINDLIKIRKGDYFESLAMTRTTGSYVDVPVWNSNGTYRTQP